MSFRRGLLVLAAFVLSGAGSFLLLTWIYYLLGWIATPGLSFDSTPNLPIISLILGAGIGLLSWLGFVIRRRRAGRPPSAVSRGAYRRSFGLSLLLFLALGTLTGLIIAVPQALSQSAFSAQAEQGVPLNDVIAYILIYGSLAVLPFVSGLLAGSRARPVAIAAFLGGMALAIGGAIVYLLPLSLLIVLVHDPSPGCATSNPPYCGFIYFSPMVEAEILDLVGVWRAFTVGSAASAAAFVGTFIFGLTDGA
jgi:hypothetical protein